MSPPQTFVTSILYPLALLFLLCALLLPLSALAAPISTPPPNQVVPIKGVYYCTGPNWTGGCAWIDSTTEHCVNIENAGGLDFSFGPDHGLVCNLYEGANCQPNEVGGLTYPGSADVSKWEPLVFAGDMKTVASWKCIPSN